MNTCLRHKDFVIIWRFFKSICEYHKEAFEEIFGDWGWDDCSGEVWRRAKGGEYTSVLVIIQSMGE